MMVLGNTMAVYAEEQPMVISEPNVTSSEMEKLIEVVLDIKEAHRKELYPLHAGKGHHTPKTRRTKAVLSSVHIIFKGTQAARRRMAKLVYF